MIETEIPLTELLLQALRIAKLAVVSDVKCGAPCVTLGDGVRWYDTRPMLDPREQPPEWIDMASQAIAFGLASNALAQHPGQAHLVRIVKQRHVVAPTYPTVTN